MGTAFCFTVEASAVSGVCMGLAGDESSCWDKVRALLHVSLDHVPGASCLAADLSFPSSCLLPNPGHRS